MQGGSNERMEGVIVSRTELGIGGIHKGNLEWVKNKIKPRDQAERIEEIRKKVLESVEITDETGEKRLADLKNPRDIAILKSTRNVYVKTKDGETIDSQPERGMVSIKPKDLPFNPRPVLPLNPYLITDIMSTEANSINEVITTTPVIPIPVFTSSLFLLITGDTLGKVMDSVSLIRCYMAFTYAILKTDIPVTRKKTTIEMLVKKFDEKTLVISDIKKMVAASKVKSESKVVLKDYIRQFKDGRLTRESLLALQGALESVEPYQCEWGDRTYKEDILKYHSNQKIERNELFGDQFEKIREASMQGDITTDQTYTELLRILYELTFDVLNGYEIQFMRLIGDGVIPREFYSDMITRRAVPNPTEVDKTLISLIAQKRTELQHLREVFLDRCEKVTRVDPVTGAVQSEIITPHSKINETGETLDPLPTMKDFEFLYQFVNYDSPDPKKLVEDMKRLKKFLEQEYQLKLRAEPEPQQTEVAKEEANSANWSGRIEEMPPTPKREDMDTD